jgi:hypothetical protein
MLSLIDYYMLHSKLKAQDFINSNHEFMLRDFKKQKLLLMTKLSKKKGKKKRKIERKKSVLLDRLIHRIELHCTKKKLFSFMSIRFMMMQIVMEF